MMNVSIDTDGTGVVTLPVQSMPITAADSGAARAQAVEVLVAYTAATGQRQYAHDPASAFRNQIVRTLAATILHRDAPRWQVERRSTVASLDERRDPRKLGRIAKVDFTHADGHRRGHASRAASRATTVSTRPHAWRPSNPRSLPAIAPRRE